MNMAITIGRQHAEVLIARGKKLDAMAIFRKAGARAIRGEKELVESGAHLKHALRHLPPLRDDEQQLGAARGILPLAPPCHSDGNESTRVGRSYGAGESQGKNYIILANCECPSTI